MKRPGEAGGTEDEDEMSTAATGAKPVSRAEFDETFEACKNWGRWGPGVERGALNYIGPDQVKAAAALVRSGRTVTCSWPLDTKAGPDNPKPVLHHMTMGPDVALGDSGDLRFLLDFMGMEPHGDASRGDRKPVRDEPVGEHRDRRLPRVDTGDDE